MQLNIVRMVYWHWVSAAFLSIFLHMLPAIAHADGCEVSAFASPDDVSNEYPLTRPHSDFSKTLKAAMRGNALEQRNLASSYEGGYLVSPCIEKATYWYHRAAKGGDNVAKDWVQRHAAFEKLAAGPECMEASCNLSSGDLPQFLSMSIDSGMKFMAPLTINGITVPGHVDTGAYGLLIDSGTAARMGISTGNARQGLGSGANGATFTTFTTTVPAIKVGNITLNNAEVVIGPPGSSILIGMTVLNRLRLSAADGQMTLSR